MINRVLINHVIRIIQSTLFLAINRSPFFPMKRPLYLTGITLVISIALGVIDNAATAEAGSLAGNWFNHMANRWQTHHQQLIQGDRLSCNLVSVSPKRQITRLCATQSQLSQH